MDPAPDPIDPQAENDALRFRLQKLEAMVASLQAPPAAAAPPALYLVTLAGPGTAGDRGVLPDALRRLALRHEQDSALAGVGSPTPVYRWTTALNGVAVRLTAGQAAVLYDGDRVVGSGTISATARA